MCATLKIRPTAQRHSNLKGRGRKDYAINPLAGVVTELEGRVIKHLFLKLVVYLLQQDPGIATAGAVGHRYHPCRRHCASESVLLMSRYACTRGGEEEEIPEL